MNVTFQYLLPDGNNNKNSDPLDVPTKLSLIMLGLSSRRVTSRLVSVRSMSAAASHTLKGDYTIGKYIGVEI